MENYIKKAADAFLVERPYGMRVDYRKKGFVLFNRNLNVLGNAEHARLEELPLERFNVEEIPLEGEVVEEHAGFTDAVTAAWSRPLPPGFIICPFLLL